jgi:hypothetical protein
MVLVLDAVQCMKFSFFLTPKKGFFLTPNASNPITQARSKGSKGRETGEAFKAKVCQEAFSIHHSQGVAIIG